MNRITLRCEGEDIPCIVREYHPTRDHGLVYDAWLKTHRASEWAKHMGNSTYFDNHRSVIERILDRDTLAARVVALESSPNVVLSWLIGELAEPTIHFAWTKGSWKEAGAARALVATLSIEGGWPLDCEIACTHHTPHFDLVRNRSRTWRRRLVFNPYRLFERNAA